MIDRLAALADILPPPAAPSPAPAPWWQSAAGPGLLALLAAAGVLALALWRSRQARAALRELRALRREARGVGTDTARCAWLASRAWRCVRDAGIEPAALNPALRQQLERLRLHPQADAAALLPTLDALRAMMRRAAWQSCLPGALQGALQRGPLR